MRKSDRLLVWPGSTTSAAAAAAAASRACRRDPRHPRPLPFTAAIHDTVFGEFVPLSDKAGVPVLVRLRERPWGALARLPPAKLVEAGYEGGCWRGV